jgi:hypothetical protein
MVRSVALKILREATMGDMGENQETVEEFITHSFDPFKNETITKSNLGTAFKATDIAFFQMTIERFQSAGATDEDEGFDVNRLVIAGLTEPKGHSRALDLWGAIQISEIVFNCDQENVVCEELWSSVPEMDEGPSLYQSFNTCLVIFASTDQLRKVAFAEELEIRVITQNGNIDLTDEEEEDFQDSLKLFYNQTYDQSEHAEDVEKIKEKTREKLAIIKENQEFQKEVERQVEESGCFIATAVYEREDHFNLIVLRSFRDNFLGTYAYGRKFISFYYKHGPSLAKKVSGNRLLKRFFKFFVDLGVLIVRKLKIG